jgi:anaerobic selenocysteine-containing dehydrogenase
MSILSIPTPAAPPRDRVTHRSACPLDCPDACSLDVTVEAGRVVRVEGAADRNPLTAGFICSKVRKLPEHVHGDERIATPHRRVGAKGEGRFEPCGWDEALDLVARRLLAARERSGGESILPYSYGGSNGLLTQDTADALLFRRLGASRLARTVCAAPTGRAAMGLYGKMEGVALGDYEHARLVVVWGMNPHASGIHLVPPIQRAREHGARLVVVDPRRIPLAAQADLHLALRPGSDLAVALAVIRELFERGAADLDFLRAHATGWEELRRRAAPWTLARAAEVAGIPVDELVRFVDLYAASAPAVVRCGWGLERNRNGGSAVAAVLALPAVAGKFGVRGGGYTMSNSAAWRFDASALAGPEPATRTINMNRLGQALTDASEPRIDVLFVYNSNALTTSPRQELIRQGLLREDLFTVVFDAVWTDTARYADVVLPATTFLEHSELARGYGAYVLHRIEPVIPPVGEARSNYTVFAELARRTAVAGEGELPSEAEAVERLLDSTGRGEALRRQLAALGYAEPAAGAAPVQFVDVFPRTHDRKVDLVPSALDAEAPGGLYAYRDDPATTAFPLALISPATQRTTSSTFGQLRRDAATLAIHPEDADVRGVVSGDLLRVWNELGEVRVRAHVSAAVRPGVVELPKGLWARHTENGATANALAPDSLTDLGGGACFNDARVEIARCLD